MMQSELPLDHDFIVKIALYRDAVVRAGSATEAKQAVEAQLTNEKNYSIVSIERADIWKARLEEEKAEAAKPVPPGRGPAPSGTPRAGKQVQGIFTKVVADPPKSA